ncbi:hypothetical protein DFH06DRAFT_101457 [Mycena polygramma]|nr:hypothetical protein DFH06DRAFT_101457 [Mycena polygramma]
MSLIGATQPPVIRFQDTDLLPLNSPADHPKVIKSGVASSHSSQHPNSQSLTGPDGIVTLLYHLSQPEVLERLLDTEGTATFAFRMKPSSDKEGDIYVKRKGLEVEIGLVATERRDERKPKLGIRYTIGARLPSSPYRTGPWLPQASFDPALALGSAWDANPALARTRGAVLARAVWHNFHLQHNSDGKTSGRAIERVEWADMAPSDREKYDKWIADFKQRVEEGNEKHSKEYQKLKAEIGIDAILASGFDDFKKTFSRCRAECGVTVATMQCGKCHFALRASLMTGSTTNNTAGKRTRGTSVTKSSKTC